MTLVKVPRQNHGLCYTLHLCLIRHKQAKRAPQPRAHMARCRTSSPARGLLPRSLSGTTSPTRCAVRQGCSPAACRAWGRRPSPRPKSSPAPCSWRKVACIYSCYTYMWLIVLNLCISNRGNFEFQNSKIWNRVLVPRRRVARARGTIGSGSACLSVRLCLSVCLSDRQQFLFRARSPILLGGINWNFAQWKNIYCSCAPGYRFYRVVKNVPVGLGQKSRFFKIRGLSYSVLDLSCYPGIEWNVSQWKNICCSCAPGYWFYRAAKKCACEKCACRTWSKITIFLNKGT